MQDESLADRDDLKDAIHRAYAGVAYSNFIRLAQEAGDRLAEVFFTQSRDVEEFHARLYKEALANMLEERGTTYYVCEVCGYVSDGVLPDGCPVCGAARDRFFRC